MLVHPQFDPVAFSLGPLQVHWYGLMYLVGFLLFWLLGRNRALEPWRGMTPEEVEDLLFYGVFGVVLGGRLGFCLFYQSEWYFAHPLDIFKVWHGGMSAHGGMIGVVAAMFLFARAKKKSFLAVADFVTPLTPLGLFFGRIGNFVNGELWGRVSDGGYAWLMAFPQSGGFLPRHPSQLYEATLEGALLFILLWGYSKKKRPLGSTAALFCVGYGLARFFVEFFREPDRYLGLGLFGLSRGQWLSVPLIVLGVAVAFWSLSRTKSKNIG